MYIHFQIIFTSLWGHFGVTLGTLWVSFWSHFEITLGSIWDHLEPFGDYLRVIRESFDGHLGVIWMGGGGAGEP